MITGTLVPHLWRVPTDNDEGGGNRSFAHRWRQAGLNNLTVSLLEMQANQVNPKQIRVSIDNNISGKNGIFLQNTIYTIFGSGDIVIESTFKTQNEWPPLPRIGVQLQVPGDLESFTWYGRGPLENYWDRKTGARVGIYRSSVSEQHFAYVHAQENGNRSDVRWFTLTDKHGLGLLVSGYPTINVSVHDYSDAALMKAKQTQEIERDGQITVSIDLQQMGVGGDDSWSPRTHPEYLLREKTYNYSFRIRPIDISKPEWPVVVKTFVPANPSR
jgi:beta-galactosidase